MPKLLIDFGHSASTWGKYWTPGKRSPEIPPGFFEGDFNRKVGECINYDSGIIKLNPGPYPISLWFRTDYINQIARYVRKELNDDVMLLSIHANAHGNGKKWTGANGFTIFTHPRKRWGAPFRAQHKEPSLKFAKILERQMIKHVPLHNRGRKEVKFSIIGVDCPAVLLECGFMTNLRDVEFLWELGGFIACANAINETFAEWRGGE